MLATDKGVAYLTLLFSGDFNNWGLGLVSNIILETFSGEKSLSLETLTNVLWT